MGGADGHSLVRHPHPLSPLSDEGGETVAIIGGDGQTDGFLLVTLTRYKAANIEN